MVKARPFENASHPCVRDITLKLHHCFCLTASLKRQFSTLGVTFGSLGPEFENFNIPHFATVPT